MIIFQDTIVNFAVNEEHLAVRVMLFALLFCQFRTLAHTKHEFLTNHNEHNHKIPCL